MQTISERIVIAVLAAALFILALFVFGIVLGGIIYLLWNAVIPDLGGPVITYWQAVGIYYLSNLIFKGAPTIRKEL